MQVEENVTIKVPSEVIVNCEFVNNQSKFKSNLKKKMIQTTKQEFSSDFPLLSHFKVLIGTAVTQAKGHFLRVSLFLHLDDYGEIKAHYIFTG